MEFYKLTKGESIPDVIGHRKGLINPLSGKECINDIFALTFDHNPSYLQDAKPLSLIALICIQQKNKEVFCEASCLPATPEHIDNLKDVDPDFLWLQKYTADYQAPWLNLSAPLLLEPIFIPKPWGQEIWYTGIEARGQSRVSDGRFSVPLPWVLELLPQQKPLTLLKILDPLADKNLGNLYFELHEQKQEAYIVTHVDPDVWPDGIGQIQIGFCQQKRKEFSSDSEFKNAYLRVVTEYRQIRKMIDQSIDQLQENSDQDRGTLYRSFSISEANKPLIDREQELHRAMNAFINHHPLCVGDVIKVPCYTPHSLQHGVRVVEFQTPVYERKILSFGQKVITQDEWDTQEAMTIAHVNTAHLEAPEGIASSSDYQLERIVNFDDFQVQRLIVKEPISSLLKIEANTLIMLIKGSVHFSSQKNDQLKQFITPGQACLLTPIVHGQNLVVEADSILLVAMPNSIKWSELD